MKVYDYDYEYMKKYMRALVVKIERDLHLSIFWFV